MLLKHFKNLVSPSRDRVAKLPGTYFYYYYYFIIIIIIIITSTEDVTFLPLLVSLLAG